MKHETLLALANFHSYWKKDLQLFISDDFHHLISNLQKLHKHGMLLISKNVKD